MKVWGAEGGLQENDRINYMSCKEIIKVHGRVSSNNVKSEFVEKQKDENFE